MGADRQILILESRRRKAARTAKRYETMASRNPTGDNRRHARTWRSFADSLQREIDALKPQEEG